MSVQISRRLIGLLVVAAVLSAASTGWAVFHGLKASKDDWGLKYGVQVSAAEGDKLNVVLTLADEGRLKPIHSITLVAFSKETDSQGGRSYDVKAPFVMKSTEDGKRVGQVQFRKEFADRAMVRILTLNVDGKRQTAGAAYYDIPFAKFMTKGPAVASPGAPEKVTR